MTSWRKNTVILFLYYIMMEKRLFVILDVISF